MSGILRDQRQIKEQADDPLGKYSRFKPEATDKLTDVQARIFRLSGESDSIDHLVKNEKVELFNAIEEVRAIIDDDEDDRLVCTRGH